MNCEQTEELLTAYSLAALPDDEAADVRAHLATCRRHDASLAELESVAKRLPLTVDDVEPPGGLRSRLLDAFDAAVAAESKVTRLSPARRSRPAMRPRFAYLAAAAVLVLAVVGLSVWNVMLQARDNDGGATVVAQLTGEAGSGQVVYLPDQQLAVLTLDLPELPSDRTYQAWRIDDGQPASLGLVPNTGVVAMDVDLGGANAVAISDEPAGGSDQPTSTPLVVAELR